jgi:hypothetical protein
MGGSRNEQELGTGSTVIALLVVRLLCCAASCRIMFYNSELQRILGAAGQFARRQKLTAETLRRLGRVAPPSPPEELSPTVISDHSSSSVEDGLGLLGPVELLPGQTGEISPSSPSVCRCLQETYVTAAGVFAGNLSHPSRKSKMRPEHRHLSMHHSAPPPRPVHIVVQRSDHFTHEVHEHEHELAKLNGCYGKAQVLKEQKECNMSAPDQVNAPRRNVSVASKHMRHQQLPPLQNPPQQPRG